MDLFIKIFAFARIRNKPSLLESTTSQIQGKGVNYM